MEILGVYTTLTGMGMKPALFDNPHELSSHINNNQAPFIQILKTLVAVLKIKEINALFEI